ncbi:sigma-70 RNA polymerase sigma factor region 4 domain-containing protein [Clostridium estertheticum]|uniref:RNA polymerase subunit sigma n=1 Tax=Clostridium estertheticum TaxID=238834 RepID=UPI001CCCD223|nr:RNA polymerase subunit sigma [Clostridium estertheticum]MBZ9615312.1 RNA polymerase subunit sigma [Clostridium estertheticum subsp. laramiense]WAG75201.1 RNA polymerase subunit sigma [Clostridium estertheticum]
MSLYKKTEYLLYNYKTMKAEIKNINLEIAELEKEYAGCKATTFEEKSAPTNKFNSSVENEMIIRIYGPEELEEKKHKLEVQIEMIDNALETLSDDEMNLIKLRYFNKLQFKAIGERVSMNDIYCISLKTKIINKIIPLIFIRNNLETS